MARRHDFIGEENSLRIPGDAFTFEGFQRWVESGGFPENGHIDYLQGDIEVDMSPEDLHTHGIPKTAICAALHLLIAGRRGDVARPAGSARPESSECLPAPRKRESERPLRRPLRSSSGGLERLTSHFGQHTAEPLAGRLCVRLRGFVYIVGKSDGRPHGRQDMLM